MKNIIQHTVKILLIEDNEGDIVLTMEALSEGQIKNEVFIARDGEQAISFLNKEAPYIDAPTPDMILLDINLPKIDGKEVLHYIKSHPILKAIPVVMLTTSDAENDIMEAYANHANCFITKPVDLYKFFEVVKSLEAFWVYIVKLPTALAI